MCQAYDSERSFILSMEGTETVNGFKAALNHQPKKKNPWSRYKECFGFLAESWDHGWECFEGGLLPWEIESELRERYPNSYERIAKDFRDTGGLSPELKLCLNI